MSAEGFFGPNEQSLVDMIQMWGLAKTTGVLTVKSGTEEGEVHFQSGSIVSGKAGQYLVNEDAIYHLLAMEEGKFRFVNSETVNGNGNLNLTYDSLMMEAMRRLDHLRQEQAVVKKKYGFIPFINEGSDVTSLTDEEKVFIGLVDNKKNLEKVFNSSGLGVYKSYEIYKTLSTSNIIGLRKVRVLIVDDQQMWRKVLTEMITKEDNFEVAGVAEDGVEALKMLSDLKPDVMTLDLEMPNLDGIKTLYWMLSGGYDILLESQFGVKIKEVYRCPVVVISAVAKKMAPETLEALMGGATSYIMKPNQFSSESLEDQQQRIAKIVMMASQVDLQKSRRLKAIDSGKKISENQMDSSRKIVCVGASMVGGLTSLMQFVPSLPPDIDGSVFVIIDDLNLIDHAESFAEFLDKHSKIKVMAASRNMLLRKGAVYICPGSQKIEFGMTTIEGNQYAAFKSSGTDGTVIENPIDSMVINAMNCKGFDKRVGLVLAGDGADGKIGFLEMVKNGDKVFAQDSYSSLNPIKPENVSTTGVARILPLGVMAKSIVSEIGKKV